MTWRDRLHSVREWMAVDADIDREQWIFAWIAWFVTLIAVPVLLYGSPVLAGIASGSLIGLWIGGAYWQLRERGSIPVIEYE